MGFFLGAARPSTYYFSCATALRVRTVPVTLMCVLPALILACINPTRPDPIGEKDAAVAAVEVTPDSMTLRIGEVGQVSCLPKNNVGTVLADACYSNSWDTAIASVASTGPQTSIVTANQVGQGWIVTGVGEERDSFRVSVIDTVALSPTPCVRAVNVSALGALTSALTVALPGDCINLAAGTYSLTSPLRINRSGTASQPITIQGTGSNTVINLQQQEMTFESASYVHLRNMRLTNFPLRGLWLNGASDYNVLDSLEIDHTQHEAVSPKGTSSHNIFQNNWIHDTGIAAPQWGEGFYVGGDDASGTPLYGVTDNQILNNRIGPNVRAQSVDISEGADRTVVRGNVINGMGTQWIPSEGSAALLIGVTASGAIIDNNQLQYGSPNGIVFYAPRNYTMTGNVVTNNTIDLQNIHNVTDRAFYGFNLTAGTIEPGRVTPKCNNTVSNGAFSNAPCTP